MWNKDGRLPHWGWWIAVGILLLIFAALLLPSMNSGFANAPKAQANTMISQLKVAVQGFHTEYGIWPPTNANGRIDNALLYHVLLGDSQGIAGGNTRQIVFMEFANKDLDDPRPLPTTFVDPWWRLTGKNPAQAYRVQIVNDEVRVSDPGPPYGKIPNTDPAKFLHSW